MVFFAVNWTYTADKALAESNKTEHGVFIKDLATRRLLVECGAWADGSGALLIVRANTVFDVEELLANDPYVKHGVVTSTAIDEWKPVLGVIV